ncbi:MAG: type II secretion system protein J [Phycisphaerales bacterium JB064]
MRPARGFTLVELLVAMAMSATVMIGAVAAIGIGGRAFRSAADGVQSAGAIDALAQISADVELAIAFTERTDTATTFWVPDRTGDGAPELLRYAWGGTAGDPVTFSMNGSTPVTVLSGVRDLSLDYVIAAVDGQATFAGPVPPEPEDELLFNRSYTASGNAHTLTATSSVAAIVKPTISGSTFRITRVQIPLKGATGGGAVRVALHRVNMSTAGPETTALTTKSVSQADLPSAFSTIEIELDSTTDFNAGDFIAIVVSQGVGLSSGQVALEPSPQYLTDGWIATTSLTGSWSINATRDMPIAIYGIIDFAEATSQGGGQGAQSSSKSSSSSSKFK